jgi:hypothetical protein
MDLQSIFAYGLVLVFFVALFVFSPLLLTSTESPQDAAKVEVGEEGDTSKTRTVAYGIVAGIFAILTVLTFISNKGRKRNSS